MIKGCLLLYACLYTIIALAQPPGKKISYITRLYTEEDGLEQKNIVAVEPDKRGFLWIGTNAGIFRFDGATFTKTSGISGNQRIYGITVKDDKITAYTADNFVITISPPLSAHTEQFNRSKHGFFLTGGNDVMPMSKNWDPAREDSLDLKWHNNSFKDIGYRYANDTFIIAMHGNPGFYTPSGFISEVSIESYYSLQMLVMQKKIIHLNLPKNSVDIYNARGKLLYREPQQRIIHGFGYKYIFKASEDIFYVYADSLLYRYALKDEGCQLLSAGAFKPKENISQIVEYNHKIYVATSNGLYVLMPNNFTNVKLKSDENLPTNGKAMVSIPNNKILANHNNIIDASGKITVDPKLRDIFFTAMYRDSKKQYWFQLGGSGQASDIVRADDPQGKWEPIFDIHKNVSSFFESKDGTVWVSSICEIGCITPNKRYQTVLHFCTPGVRDTPYNYHVYSITETMQGEKLFGSQFGIKTIAPSGRRFINYSNNTQLNTSEVRYIGRIGNTNRFLACTYGNGLWMIDHDKKNIRKISPENSQLNFVHQFLADEQGLYWFTTNSGLFATSAENILKTFDQQDYIPYFYRFTHKDGLMENEFDGGYQSAMLTLDDGKIAATNSAGVILFSPKDIQFYFDKNPGGIDEITIDEKPVEFSNAIYIPRPDKSVVNIKINMPDYISPENQVLEFSLQPEGKTSDPIWQPVSASRDIALSQIHPGKYTLSLRKRTGFGEKDFVYTYIPVEVQGYWYQSIWFFLLILVFAVIIVYAYLQWRNYNTRKENIKLNKRVNEATEELILLNDHLQKSNDVKNKLITLFNHDITVPIHYMNQSLQNFVADADVPETYKKQLKHTGKTAEELVKLSEEMLTWIRSNQNLSKLTIHREYFSLADSIEKNLQLFSEKITAAWINIETGGLTGFLVFSDKSMFNTIVYNILSNSIKYSSQNTITIRLKVQSEEDDLYCLEIRNPVSEWTESSKQHTADKSLKDLSRGFGLGIVQDACKLLGYDFTLSVPGEGFVVADIGNIKGFYDAH